MWLILRSEKISCRMDEVFEFHLGTLEYFVTNFSKKHTETTIILSFDNWGYFLNIWNRDSVCKDKIYLVKSISNLNSEYYNLEYNLNLNVELKKYSPIKNSGFFEDVAQIYVGIQKVRVQSNSFLEMVNCQPYFTLCIKNTPKVTPGNGKIWSRLNSLQVTSLIGK